MSYILEALKRAEIGSVNGDMRSLVSHPNVAVQRQKGRFSIYLLVTSLFLNAGMIFWCVYPPWQKDQAAVQFSDIRRSLPLPSAVTPPRTVQSDATGPLAEPARRNNIDAAPSHVRR